MVRDGDEPPSEYFIQDFRSSPGWLKVAEWCTYITGGLGIAMLCAGFIVTVAARSWHGGILQITGILILLTGAMTMMLSIPRYRSSYYIFGSATFKLRIRSMYIGPRGMSESTVRFPREEIASVSLALVEHFWRYPLRRESVVQITYLLLNGSRHGHELLLTSWDSDPIAATQLREYLVFLDDLERCLAPEQLPNVQGLAQAREAIQQTLNRAECERSMPGEATTK